jgi:hypothetical protein
LATATFAQADLTAFRGYDGRLSTILDSGLFHVLPAEKRRDYLRSIFLAAAPGAVLYILAFAVGALDDRGHRPGRPQPRGFTETELRDAAAAIWEVDDVRPAKLYGNAGALAASGASSSNAELDDDGNFVAPGFLLSAHKPER